MASQQRSALIVGAGIAGLATARALQRTGWKVHVVERSGTLQPMGTGLTIWANGARALERLGLLSAFQDASLPVSGSSHDQFGNVLASFSSDDMRHRYGHPLRAIHRSELTALLNDSLYVNTVHLGLQAVKFRRDPHGGTVMLNNGGRMHADLVIGADGLRSLVRNDLVGDGAPRSSGITAMRAVCPIGDLDPGWLPWGESWGNGEVFGMVPLPGGQIYWYATMPNEALAQEDDVLWRTLALQRFDLWHPAIRAVIRATKSQDIMAHELFDRKPALAWSGNHATLVGDAAHPMLPFLGQGVGQALEDAVALADALAADWNITTALRSYEQARAPHTAKVVKGSRKMANMAREQKPWKQKLQRSLISMLPQAMVYRQLDDVVGRVDG
jgi:2-polyprenyl-6-methoxyphenol hydroxylase-like FAD-dependent oxidoreductase